MSRNIKNVKMLILLLSSKDTNTAVEKCEVIIGLETYKFFE